MSTLLATPRKPETADAPKFWTTAEFDRLIGLGVLAEGSATYLWEGQIVEPMPEYQPHWNAVCRLFALLLGRFLEADWTVGQSGSLALEDGTKPQPDLLVLKGARTRYRVASVGPADVALLIEVSDGTYPRDSGERLRKYAAAGVALYWIVNIPERRVEVYEDARPSDVGTMTYQKRTDFGLGQSVPLDVRHGGTAVVGDIAVIDILRDSLGNLEGPEQA